jgi:hypothetical protein
MTRALLLLAWHAWNFVRTAWRQTLCFHSGSLELVIVEPGPSCAVFHSRCVRCGAPVTNDIPITPRQQRESSTQTAWRMR